MWRGLITVAGIGFLSGTALAQTSDIHDNDEGGIFLPAALNIVQFPNSPMENFGNGKSYGTAYGFDLGNGFKTEIEGLSSNATSTRLGGLAASGNLASARVTLKGMYEFRDGEWHMKPYVGAGFGMIDVNEHILGVAENDWVGAYQLRGGVTLGFTQKLLGSLEYRWAMGSKPHFSLAGIPTKLEVDRHGFVLGINYKY